MLISIYLPYGARIVCCFVMIFRDFGNFVFGLDFIRFGSVLSKLLTQRSRSHSGLTHHKRRLWITKLLKRCAVWMKWVRVRESGVSAVLDTITHSQALFFLSMLCHYYCYRVNKAFDVHFAQFYLSFVFVALDFLALSLSVSLSLFQCTLFVDCDSRCFFSALLLILSHSYFICALSNHYFGSSKTLPR